MTANENEINDALYVAYVRGISDGRKQVAELKATFAATLDAKEADCKQRLAAAESRIKELESKQKYGCHVDLEHGVEPDACVLDTNEAYLCIYAERLVWEGKNKTACQYWKIIKGE